MAWWFDNVVVYISFAMAPEPVLSLVLVISLGMAFFLVDYYSDDIKVHPSLIAGFSLAYFFLVVIPEISVDLPNFLRTIPTLEYLFVLVGICFAHLNNRRAVSIDVILLVLDVILQVNLELVYVLFSFIAGALLYITMREVMPEKEKGKPKMFLIAVFMFGVLVVVIKLLQHHLVVAWSCSSRDGRRDPPNAEFPLLACRSETFHRLSARLEVED